jgi:hypothetical protein
MPQYQTGHDEMLPEGTYDFTVEDATERTSEKGNQMIELQQWSPGFRPFDLHPEKLLEN